MKTRRSLKSPHVLALNLHYFAGTLSKPRWVTTLPNARRFDLAKKEDYAKAEGLCEQYGGKLFPVDVSPSTLKAP